MPYLPTEYYYISQAASHSFLVKYTQQVRYLAELNALFMIYVEQVTFFSGQEKGMLIAIYMIEIPWTMIPLKNMEYMAGRQGISKCRTKYL